MIMKKLILVIALSTSHALFAQLNWGLTTGLHFSNLGRADLRESSYAMNFHSGLVANFAFRNSGLHLQGQILYKPMGYKNSNILAASDAVMMAGGAISSHRISYVEIPVYFMYGGKTKGTLIKAGAGPFIALKTGDRLTLEGGEKFGNESVLPVNTNEINPVLTGLSMQVSGEWSRLFLSLQFQKSLNNIYKNNAGPGTRWRMNIFGLSAGYYF
jgi:hypothetical protein